MSKVKLTFSEDRFDAIFTDWVENNLSLQTRNNDEKMANLYTLTKDWFLEKKPRSVMEIEEYLQHLANKICGTTF